MDQRNQSALELIRNAKRPVAYIGKDCRDEPWLDRMVRYLEGQAVPFFVNFDATDMIQSDSAFFLGGYGYNVGGLAMEFIYRFQPDLILVIGGLPGEVIVSAWSPQFNSIENKLYVDVCTYEDKFKSRPGADISLDLTDLAEILLSTEFSDPVARRQEVALNLGAQNRNFAIVGDHLNGIGPRVFVQQLLTVVADDAMLFFDLNHTLQCEIGNLKVQTPMEIYSRARFDSGGSSLCRAIGAKAANPNRLVVAVVDSSSMTKYGSELISARKSAIAVKVFVLNDVDPKVSRFGGDGFDLLETAWTDDSVDFAHFATGLGVDSMKLSTVLQLSGSAFLDELQSDEVTVFYFPQR